MNDTVVGEIVPRETAIPRGALGVWWAQGARSIVFQSPDWSGLQLTPAVLAILWLLPAALAVGIERRKFERAKKFAIWRHKNLNNSLILIATAILRPVLSSSFRREQ